ncbi:MAG: AmmeMemoRadiSam system protein A [Sedimentisphaerales bacterium]|nr:AmmeMemoRadiSam system protein A [Sedimentisphaerales bacterium]
MNDEQKRRLLAMARRVITQAACGQPVSTFTSDDPVLNEQRGCFVTLHNHGRLRGCIGNFQPGQPLIQTVHDMALAALRDSRFVSDPITPTEVGHIDIEISVLSPLERTDNPLNLELGKHGIYIKKGFRGGCFLPQVATETGWTKEEFLGYCCSHKAGLSPDAWRDPDTEVMLFTAEIFSEESSGQA